jgi:hypothetical protein
MAVQPLILFQLSRRTLQIVRFCLGSYSVTIIASSAPSFIKYYAPSLFSVPVYSLLTVIFKADFSSSVITGSAVHINNSFAETSTWFIASSLVPPQSLPLLIR